MITVESGYRWRIRKTHLFRVWSETQSLHFQDWLFATALYHSKLPWTGRTLVLHRGVQILTLWSLYRRKNHRVPSSTHQRRGNCGHQWCWRRFCWRWEKVIKLKSCLSTKLVLEVALTLDSCGARGIHLEEPTKKMHLDFPQSKLNRASRENEEIYCPTLHLIFVMLNFWGHEGAVIKNYEKEWEIFSLKIPVSPTQLPHLFSVVVK